MKNFTSKLMGTTALLWVTSAFATPVVLSMQPQGFRFMFGNNNVAAMNPITALLRQVRIRLAKAAVACIAMTSLVATAAPTLVLDPAGGFGSLLGARNVEVLGVDYNVSFRDGSCNSLLNGCTTFTFNTLAGATAASQALLNQVFLNFGPGQSFDENPELTRGCTQMFAYCAVVTAYGLNSANDEALEVTAYNSYSGLDSVAMLTIPIALNTGPLTLLTYAEWSLAADETTVPEPGNFALLAIGLAGLGLTARARKVFSSV